MGDVVALPGYSIPTPKSEPVKSVVEALKEYLSKAEAGQIRAIGLAIVFHDGFSEKSIETDFTADAGCAWLLDTAIGRLKRRFEDHIDN